MSNNDLVGLSVGETGNEEIIKRFEDGHDVYDLIDDTRSSSAMLTALSGASIEDAEEKIPLLNEEDKELFYRQYVSSVMARDEGDDHEKMSSDDVDLIEINDIISQFNEFYEESRENGEEVTFREYLSDRLSFYGDSEVEAILEILEALGVEYE